MFRARNICDDARGSGAHHKGGFFKAELSHEALSSGVKGGKGFDSRLHL